jgi:PTH1 family peptidyl-tRNA hydrolase
MGVGRPEHGDVAAFVLKMFSSDEKITLNDFVNDGARAIEDLVAEGLVGAQNCYHAK